jgi:hypothetical protein
MLKMAWAEGPQQVKAKGASISKFKQSIILLLLQ